MPDQYRIVAATPAEYATIREIAHATWPDTFGEILSEAQIDYMLELMYNVEELARQVEKGVVFRLLLAATAGEVKASPDYAAGTYQQYQPVGYVGYQLDYLPGTTKIHKLYLLPSTQGNGFGRGLIEDVVCIARRAGQSTLRLDVNYQNRAIGFYEYLGFVKTERCTTDIGNGYLMEDWIMELTWS